MTASPRPPRNCTDLGNAERLVDAYGDRIRYCAPLKQWRVFDGKRWEPDETGRVVELAKLAVKRIYDEAAAATDSQARKELAKHAVNSESAHRIRAMMTLAESADGIPVRPAEFDSDAFAFNVANGTVDLRTGRLRPHNRDELITKLAPITYDIDAPCDRWERFLLEAMSGDRERVAFLQRAIGYSLTAATDEQCLFIPFGAGANGKTVLEETVRALAGEYAAKADFSTFLRHNGESPRHDLARLFGARVVTASEVNEGKRLDEAVVKDITGSGTIAARRLYADSFEFAPTFKIWLSANHKPIIGETGHGIWRRVRLIPFDVIVPPEKQDPKLLETLRAELPGILAWAVAGCMAWQQQRLGMPTAIAAATSAYRDEMDVLGGFLDECCALDPDYDESAGQLYDAYRRWADRAGEHPLTRTSFGRKLSERGFEARKSGSSNTVRRFGLHLRSDSYPPLTTSPNSSSLYEKDRRTLRTVRQPSGDAEESDGLFAPSSVRFAAVSGVTP